jgi:hypothetical protein
MKPKCLWRKCFADRYAMSPQLESTLTTVLAAVFGALILRGTGGLLSDSDRATLAAALANAAMAIGGVAALSITTWWKQRQRSPAAIVKSAVEQQPAATARAMAQSQPEAAIRAINLADNGVKVVAEGADAPAVEKPLRGPRSYEP